MLSLSSSFSFFFFFCCKKDDDGTIVVPLLSCFVILQVRENNYSSSLLYCGKNDNKQLHYLLSLFCDLAGKKKMRMVLLSSFSFSFSFLLRKKQR